MVDNCVLLSFILPIYNVEVYLPECIDSILQQATNECEIVLVNDGSNDSSGSICDDYARNSQIVRVIHKENGGLSSARNEGLLAAQGKYITFVDSDDRLFAGCVDKILNWIKNENADICFLKAAKLYPNGEIQNLGENICRENIYLKDRETAIRHLATRPKYPGSAWSKLFRRDFLTSNDLHFPYDRRYSEDLGFIRDCIIAAEKFDSLPVFFYQYRQNREGSITHDITVKNFSDLFQFITDSVDKLTRDRKCNDSALRLVMGFVAYEYSILILHYYHIPQKERNSALERLNEYKWVLKYSQSKKTKLIKVMVAFLGIRNTSKLLNFYRRVRK